MFLICIVSILRPSLSKEGTYGTHYIHDHYFKCFIPNPFLFFIFMKSLENYMILSTIPSLKK